MDDSTLSRARAVALRLLAAAFEAPPQGDELSTLTELSRLPPLDDEGVAEEHCAVFDRDVVPLTGLFLDAEGRGGGPLVAHLAERFATLGAPPPPTPEALSTQLRALAWLCGAEADALADGVTGEVERMRGDQRGWLDSVLLPWLPAFSAAVGRTGRGWAAALSAEALELCLTLRAGLGEAAEPSLPPAPEPPALDDERTDLGAIARWMTTPAGSGLFLGRHVLERLGRSSDVPRGFGGRALMLGNLLRSASHLGALNDVIEGLRREVLAQRVALPQGSVGDPWRRRLDTTDTLLDRLAAGR